MGNGRKKPKPQREQSDTAITPDESTSSLNTALENTITRTIQTELAVFTATAGTNQGLLHELKADIQSLRAENVRLSQQIQQRDQLIDQLQHRTASLESAVGETQYKIKEQAIQLNDAEQYTRKTSIRIFGLQLSGPVCDATVCEFFSDKLGVFVDPTELVAVHPLPVRRGVRRDGSSWPAPILVKFLRFNEKMRILSVRRRLKNTGITIHDDLTAANRAVLKDVMNHAAVQSAWTRKGCVIGLLTDRRKIQVRLFDNLDRLFGPRGPPVTTPILSSRCLWTPVFLYLPRIQVLLYKLASYR